jgi:hypothetical protein
MEMACLSFPLGKWHAPIAPLFPSATTVCRPTLDDVTLLAFWTWQTNPFVLIVGDGFGGLWLKSCYIL